MNTFDMVERHRRVQLICHAIRHLLDHSREGIISGDEEAINILQLAIDPPASASARNCQGEQRAAAPEAGVHQQDSLEYVF